MYLLEHDLAQSRMHEDQAHACLLYTSDAADD